MFSGWGGKPEPDTPGAKAMELSSSKAEEKKPKDGGGASIHGFDPSALERAAKAAKDLDKSKNAKDALRVINIQEATKQKEHEMERARFRAMEQELAIRRVSAEEESASRTLEKQSQHERARADYKDQLDRKRMSDQINAQRHLQEEERQKAEESLRRQEEIRRKTLEHEASLRQQTEMARVAAESEGRILQERKNHDLISEKMAAASKELRTTVLESIKLAGTTVGTGVQDFLTDKEKLTNTAITVTALALGIYAARTGTSVAGKYIEARLGKPTLVRETTKMNVLQMARHPLTTAKLAFGRTHAEEALKNIVLQPSLEQRLQRIALSTANTKKNRAPFRHLLLHGPPGTGKTMFAKGLARECGLHYAIMTGGDVAPLGSDAVTEIHKLFDWAGQTNKGVLIFVDEADAFLRKRSTEKISEAMRVALNAFLYRTGEASYKFMIVYASNQPEQFDWAINDRIDDMVEFALPTFDERLRMIAQYMETYLLNPAGGSRSIKVEGVDDELLRSFAERTESYSGREISKLAIAWQAAAYGTADATATRAMLENVLQESKLSKEMKLKWISPEDLKRITIDVPAK
ncbi:ATPase family AAA domain-containing protein 3A [Ochromonadaceae sp. CCMP2298]|nr:ATPase family AAA domain-containing protein 3A [Ochromonadaceae sp. CCMP2298]|mmetsp:Transcript_7406/g.16232  ORF Transcript_7406/g.16232 Transcript_7406/m.16232 type:complete len:580 (-) Transcript_7406:159-1898(-)